MCIRDRILAENPSDAELHAAAAVLLEEPCIHLWSAEIAKEVATLDSSAWGFGKGVFARIKEASATYDEQASKRVCELLARSTEIEPNNTDWWRLRCILLWPRFGKIQEPRDEDWRQILEEARKHDPGNALYDLLEANQLSNDSIDFDEKGDFYVRDADALKECVRLARLSVSKDQLSLGEPAMNGMVRMHGLASHGKMHTVESLRARFLASRAEHIAVGVARSLLRATDAARLDSAGETPLALFEVAESIIGLCRDRSDAAVRYGNLHDHIGVAICQDRVDLLRKEGLDAENANTKLLEANNRKNAIAAAASKWSAVKYAKVSLVLSIISSISLAMFAACAGVLALISVGRFLFPRQADELRLSWWPFLAIAGGLLVSYLFLGLGAGTVIHETAQHWLFTLISFILLIALIGGIAKRSRLRFRFGIRSLLIFSAVAAIGLQVAFHWQLGWSALGLPIEVHAESDPFVSMLQNPGLQGSAQGPPVESWLPGPAWFSKSIVQWWMHDGPVYSILLGCLLVAVILLWKTTLTKAMSELWVCLLALVLFLSCVWIWIEPSNYRASRTQQMQYESYIRSIDEYYAPFEVLLQKELQSQSKLDNLILPVDRWMPNDAR